MSRPVTVEEALALLHIEPAIPESDDPREHEPHALLHTEPYSLEYMQRVLSVCAKPRVQGAVERSHGSLTVGADPDGHRRVTGTYKHHGHGGSSAQVYRFDARPFTDAELAAGVFALLSGDRARAVDPTVLDGDAARTIQVRAASYPEGWEIGVWRYSDGALTAQLWWAKGTTFAHAADNLRAILSANYGVPND